MNRAIKFIKKNRLLIFLISLALLLRFPWLYTTIGVDEGIFGYTARAMLSGDSLYNIDLRENKPPFLYFIYAIPIYLFGNSIIPVRILNNILFAISVIVFFKFIEHFSTKENAFSSTMFYAIFMNIPVFGGYLAMSESLLTPFLIITVYLFKKYTSSKKVYFLFISSIFACITVLIKQQAIFIYFLLISGLFIHKEKNKIGKVIFILSILIIIILMKKEIFLKLLYKTWHSTFIQSDIGFSLGYRPFGYNLLIILEGSALWLFSLIGIIKVLKSKLNKNNFFIISWLILASAFTLIPPAYSHYYIFLIPPLAIFAGKGTVYVIKSKQNKRVFLLLMMMLVFLTISLMIKHYPNSTLRLYSLYWGESSFKNYQQQIFLSEYIKNVTLPEDKILILGGEPSICWLSERKIYWLDENKSPWQYFFLPDEICNEIREQIEKKFFLSKDLKAIIFLPEYERKCKNMSKEIFSNLSFNYNKVKIDDAEIYIQP